MFCVKHCLTKDFSKEILSIISYPKVFFNQFITDSEISYMVIKVKIDIFSFNEH